MVKSVNPIGHRKHKGAIAELIAAQYLYERDCEVFRNISQSGPADLVAWHLPTGAKVLVDVKCKDSAHENRDGSYSLNIGKDQDVRRTGVHLLVVRGGSVLGFYRLRSGGGTELYDPISEEG